MIIEKSKYWNCVHPIRQQFVTAKHKDCGHAELEQKRDVDVRVAIFAVLFVSHCARVAWLFCVQTFFDILLNLEFSLSFDMFQRLLSMFYAIHLYVYSLFENLPMLIVHVVLFC